MGSLIIIFSFLAICLIVCCSLCICPGHAEKNGYCRREPVIGSNGKPTYEWKNYKRRSGRNGSRYVSKRVMKTNPVGP